MVWDGQPGSLRTIDAAEVGDWQFPPKGNCAADSGGALSKSEVSVGPVENGASAWAECSDVLKCQM